MTDTKAYLRALKKSLPSIRERLIAVAVLFAMSITMMMSATFAWLVLSGSPEAKGMSLSVSGNGSLELALRTDNNAPGASQVGDSVAAGTEIKNANITWGNLVNLSAGYGLDTLALRPARLNKSGLPHGKPLEGVAYGEDGRAEGMQGDYAFTVWQPGEAGGAFVKPDNNNTGYGVRAISSMTYTYEGESAWQLKKLQENASTANANAMSAYRAITDDNGPYMDTIVKLMGDYMAWTVGASDYPTPQDRDCSNYIVPLTWLIRDMVAGLEQHGLALMYIVNTWQFNEQQTPLMGEQNFLQGRFPENFNATTFEGYDTFMADYTMFKSALTELKGCLTYIENTYGEIAERQGNMQGWPIAGAYWAQIENTVVNKLIKISKCEVMDQNGENRLPVSSIGKDEALKYIRGINTAVIMEGLLVNYEHMVGEKMNVGGEPGETPITITVKVPKDYQVLLLGKKTLDISATVITKRSETTEADYFQRNAAALDAYIQENMQVSDAVAGDTFGLVLDLWARTNVSGSILGLSGTVVTETVTEAKTEIIEGITYQIYSWIPPTADTENPEAIELYQKEDTWYKLEDHKPVNVGTDTPMPMIETIDKPIEYNGENRVWADDKLLISDGARSTTQGSGSCYIYYSDSPEAANKSLELLKNMKVAFISGDNKYLATASFDIGNALKEKGKYTIPLAITESSCSYIDENGNSVKGITRLNANEATMITAIVYLDGTELKNEHVLAAADIQGSLNLQFKSSTLMTPIDDRELMDDEISVSAKFASNPSATALQYDYRYPFNQRVEIDVEVNGFTPSTAEAFFQRQISDTQGSRMPAFNIDLRTGKGTAVFTSPGKYVLRYVRLDGVEYELTKELVVEVSGFAVDTVSVGQNYFMTADKTATTSVSVGFGSLDADELPKTVYARFMTEKGSAINVKLHQNPNGLWTGNVTFNNSGFYYLDYVVMDGVIDELKDYQKQVVEARLGMSTEIIIYRYLKNENGEIILDREDKPLTTSNLQFVLESGETANFKAYVKVKDGSNKYLTNLDTGAAGALKLYYQAVGRVDTIDADLKWDDNFGGYATESEGFFISRPGTYRFLQVVVDGNSITTAYPAPVINAMFPDPPTWAEEQNYVSGNAFEMFAPNVGDARVTVNVKNAGTKIGLIFKDQTGKTYSPIWVADNDINVVTDTNGDVMQACTVTLPTGEDGTHRGTWTLVALQMIDVNDGQGGVATDEKPFVLSLKTEQQLKFQVGVDDFTLVFNETGNIAQGDIELSGGTFMSEQKLESLYAWLIQTGGNGQNHYAVKDTQMNLTYSYQRYEGTRDLMDEYGHYTPQSGEPTVPDVVLTLKETDKQSYQLTTAGVFKVAGKYVLSKAELVVKDENGAIKKQYVHTFDGDDTNDNLGIVTDDSRPESILPEIHVKSEKPEVRVNSISNDGSDITLVTIPDPMRLTDYGANEVPYIEGKFNHKTDYSATVYIRHTKDTTALVFTYWNSHLPTVKLTLSNISENFTSASMVFPHQNREYAARDAKFDFTPESKDSTASIGYDDPVTARSDNFYPAGRAELSQIDVTDLDGFVYQVDLKHAIIINQPQYPYIASFNDKDGEGVKLETKPADVMATPNADGELAIRLPASQTWTVPMENPVPSGNPSTSTKTLYEYMPSTWQVDNGCGGKDTKNGYTNYTITASVVTSSSTTQYWNRTYTISKWIVNGREYDPNTDVVLTGNTTITAKLTYTDGTVTSSQTTTDTYTITNVAVAEKQSNHNGGTQVAEAPYKGKTWNVNTKN